MLGFPTGERRIVMPNLRSSCITHGHFAALAAVAALTFTSTACAGEGSRESSHVVTLVTHSSPGGGSDVFLRTLAPHLSRAMGVTCIVENMQGGSGARAMVALSRAKPDGRMFYATTPTYVYTSLLSKPPARYTDLEPLVNVFFDPEVLYTAADSEFRTLADVVERARKGGGRWGAANPASLERQVMERIKQKAAVTPAVTTFEGGGDMLLNVLNHTLDMGVGELQEIRAQLDAGKLRLLAVAGDERLPHLPDLPTVREQGLDVSVRKFRGLAGPKGTSPDVIAALEAAVPRLLDDPEYKKHYLDNSLLPGFIPHAEYVRFIEAFGRDAGGFLKESGVIE
jgi:tripartite-type tricarboxylate transporter receptor subunit TctC